MSVPIELWKNWEGKLIDGKFTLQKWVGGSDHSAVFVTERSGPAPRKAAAKLIPAEDSTSSGQLSHWADAVKLSHPNLIRLFEYGRCEIDGTPILYAVTELADENLAEVIPVRSLSSDEVLAVLRPASEALRFLHSSGFVHTNIKPSNIMAVGEHLKLSLDSIRKSAEPSGSRAMSPYAAPEAAITGFTPATDIWSLGMTLLAVSTQAEPKSAAGIAQPVGGFETLSQPIRGIIQRCLQIDPARRPSATEILSQVSGRRSETERDASTVLSTPSNAKSRLRTWALVPAAIVVLFLLVWVGSKIFGHQPAPAVSTQTTQPETKTESAPAQGAQASPKNGLVRGTVREQVRPDVSPTALHTITGRLKVSVRLVVDAGGNVSSVKLTSPGPSAYFSGRAVAAARQWKFDPPQVNGQAAASEWLLRFQFTRSSAQAVPSEIKP